MSEAAHEATLPRNGMPAIHPGRILLEDFLKPWNMNTYRLAKGLGMQVTAVTQILRGTRSVTPATALRLARFLGTSPRFWLNLQAAYDLKLAENELAEVLERIEPYEHQGELFLDDQIDAETLLSPSAVPASQPAQPAVR